MSMLRRIRGESVGTESWTAEAMEAAWVKSLINQFGLERTLSHGDQTHLATYVWDMGRALAEVSRVLRAGGRAVYVVGESTLRGTFVRNSAIIAALGEVQGLKLHSRYSRVLPDNRRYLPPPKRWARKQTMDARMRREVVLVFNKP
ncbi:MAG: hypothetical protein HZB43_01425 [candidate division Zixibacteria bacterium]|nr:hypothetical protein [candidate division Zixibacteria bacterium]